MIDLITLNTNKQGLVEFSELANIVVTKSGIRDGLATFFIQHTSASIIIQENADPSVLYDLQHWLNKIVKEEDSYTHTNEGVDDMPAHIKCMLTQTSISVPIINNKLALGVWQGIFLWEHRVDSHTRVIITHIS